MSEVDTGPEAIAESLRNLGTVFDVTAARLRAVVAERDTLLREVTPYRTLAEFRADWVTLAFPVPHVGCVLKVPPEVKEYVTALREQVAGLYEEGTLLTEGVMDLDDELTALRERETQWQENVEALLQKIPGAVRVREGGADEDLIKSLVVSVMKLIPDKALSKRETQWRELVDHYVVRGNYRPDTEGWCMADDAVRSAREALGIGKQRDGDG